MAPFSFINFHLNKIGGGLPQEHYIGGYCQTGESWAEICKECGGKRYCKGKLKELNMIVNWGGKGTALIVLPIWKNIKGEKDNSSSMYPICIEQKLQETTFRIRDLNGML